MDCIFCKIAGKEIPSSVVYETDDVLAFDDLSPVMPVHVLVVPKKHIATNLDIAEADEALAGKLILAANEVARIKGIDKSGFRIVMNTNADSLQSVFHIHVHVLGGRKMSWPPG